MNRLDWLCLYLKFKNIPSNNSYTKKLLTPSLLQKRNSRMQTTKQAELYKILFAGKYKIAAKMKAGSFGTVYIAKHNNREFALKLSKKDNSELVQSEKTIYQALAGAGYPPGFVRYYESGVEGPYHFIVMELLGADLQDIISMVSGKHFSVKTVLMVGLQVLDRLEVLHKLGYVHRDLKPDNLAIGQEAVKTSTIYLIDFGLAKQLPSKKTGEPKKTGLHVGTYRYMSVNAHNTLELSQRDDIETLAFVLMFLREGRVPWQSVNIDTKESVEKIKQLKMSVSKNSFNREVPQEIFEMLNYARKLHYLEMPNYDILRKCCEDGLRRYSCKNDLVFDWLKLDLKELRKFSPPRNNKNSPPVVVKPESPRNKRRGSQDILPKQADLFKKPKHEAGQINNLDKQIVAVFKFCNERDNISVINHPAAEPLPRAQEPIKPQKVITDSKAESSGPNMKKPVVSSNANLKQRPGSAAKNTVVRPNSAHKPAYSITMVQNKYQQMARLGSAMKYSGPRIVINRQAKYKI